METVSYSCKKWRAKNPEYGKIYYQKHKVKARQYYLIYYRQNRQQLLAVSKAYREKHKERLKNYYIKNREWKRDQAKKRLIKQKEIVFKYYSKGSLSCACCGEDNYKFLTLDHINNNGAAHRRNIDGNRHPIPNSWYIRNNFPDGFQILCWNCNEGKQYNNGKCPHENILNRILRRNED